MTTIKSREIRSTFTRNLNLSTQKLAVPTENLVSGIVYTIKIAATYLD